MADLGRGSGARVFISTLSALRHAVKDCDILQLRKEPKDREVASWEVLSGYTTGYTGDMEDTRIERL